jgi:hypothetical protein
MDDGNVLVGYNHDVVNVVLISVIQSSWQEIEKHRLNSFVTDEVLIISLATQ